VESIALIGVMVFSFSRISNGRQRSLNLLSLAILEGRQRILIATVSQPLWQVLFAPIPIILHGVEGAESGVVEHGLVGVNEGVPHPDRKGPAGLRLKLSEEIRWYDHRVFRD